MEIDIEGYGVALQSLGRSITRAGGDICLSQLEKMSALDLIKLIDTNNIIFTYKQPQQ